jgi:hypothetical protein
MIKSRRIRWTGYKARMENQKERAVGRRRLEDNIEMDLGDT